VTRSGDNTNGAPLLPTTHIQTLQDLSNCVSSDYHFKIDRPSRGRVSGDRTMLLLRSRQWPSPGSTEHQARKGNLLLFICDKSLWTSVQSTMPLRSCVLPQTLCVGRVENLYRTGLRVSSSAPSRVETSLLLWDAIENL
jgi:hypothetical protein